MALIKCPECGKEISDKSEFCINCGFPVSKNIHIALKNVIIISDKGYVIAKRNVTEEEALSFKRNQEKFGSKIEILNSDINIEEYYKIYANKIHCPKCGSTSIITGARGVNWTLGLIGASKTVNRCGNCGYTWTPHK